MPGEATEKMIGETVLWSKIEHHVIHPDRWETIETIEIMHNLFKDLKPVLLFRGSCGQMMNHPSPFVGSDHGGVPVRSGRFAS